MVPQVQLILGAAGVQEETVKAHMSRHGCVTGAGSLGTLHPLVMSAEGCVSPVVSRIGLIPVPRLETLIEG